MSELERFRDHAAQMATAPHSPECWADIKDTWGWQKRIYPNPECAGCISDTDRALWARLADEVDAYLANDDAPLWEDA